MKNYLEFKIPVQRNAQWYKDLYEAMQEVRIPVRWQNGFYHITVAFLHDDLHVKELREAFARILSGKKAPSITLDKLEAFQTHITLGRIDAEDTDLDEVKDIILSIPFSPFKVSIKEAEYRYFRADTIDHWKFIE